MDTSGKEPGVHITGVSIAVQCPEHRHQRDRAYITDRGVCITEVSVLQSNHLNTDTKGTESSVHITKVFVLQSNLHNTDTKGTEPSGHITEVSVFKYVALFHLN